MLLCTKNTKTKETTIRKTGHSEFSSINNKSEHITSDKMMPHWSQ